MDKTIASEALRRILDSVLHREEPEQVEVEGVDLIAGLGNPGLRYANTRHNIGFKVAEEIARRHPGGRERNRFDASIYEVVVGGRKLVVAKPLTMMNLSGRAIGPTARWYDIPNEQVLVIYDDLDLPFGRIRLRPSGGAGGHNGVASIIEHLGSPDFPRLRVGIGRPIRGSTVDYVLSRFDSEEEAQLPDLVKRCADAAMAWRSNGIQSAMNEFNRKADLVSSE
ncbi:MAG: aminoacyl-tRNA hydrolase [Chloroflexota bacterium]